MRKKLVLGNFLLLLLIFSFSVYREEEYQKYNTFYIKTAPVDPRSLMQGDYMILNYVIANQAQNKMTEEYLGVYQGYIKVRIEPKTRIAEFISIEKEKTPINEDELLIKFTRNSDNVNGVNIGVNSYMFQEGEAEKYSNAAYSEVIYLKNNKLRLKNLVDENLNKLK